MRYEVRGDVEGSYRILRQQTGEVMVVDGVEMSDLTAAAAGEYLYALNLVDAARNVEGRSLIRQAVERALKRGTDNPVRSIDDAVVAVKWMIPDLRVADDVLRLLVRKFAAEIDVILME